MPSIQDTAYPHFGKKITKPELQEIYTPTANELLFTSKVTKNTTARLCTLILLKTFQRLGYFVLIKNIPNAIIKYLAENFHIEQISDLSSLDKSGSKTRYAEKIRSYLNIKTFDEKGKELLKQTVIEISQTREDIADIINVAIEELIRHRFELPVFNTLLRAAYKGRAEVNTELYKKIYNTLDKKMYREINNLFKVKRKDVLSPWHYIKSEPKKLSVNTLRERLEHFERLSKYCIAIKKPLTSIPEVKIKQFSSEGKSLDAARMKRMKKYKKYALAVSLISTQMSILLDDFGEMFINQNIKMHNSAHKDLLELNRMNMERTDTLIETLYKIMLVREDKKTTDGREKGTLGIIGGKEKKIAEDCKRHMLYAKKNYFPFLAIHYLYQRKALFDVLDIIMPQSATQDKSLISLIDFIKTHRKTRKKYIELFSLQVALEDLSWISTRWWKFVFGVPRSKTPVQINKHHMELCVFHYVTMGLKSVDLYIKGSYNFSDYRTHLVSWEEYEKKIKKYGEQVGLPTDKEKFIQHIKKSLKEVAAKVDKAFPKNKSVRIVKGKPVIKKYKKKAKPKDLKELEKAISERLEKVSILDVLTYTREWLNWDKPFGPISGYDSKLDNPKKSHIITTFSYGCLLGPTQTERSLKDTNRFKISWINKHHITESKLNDAITLVINGYNGFELPRFWGPGKSSSVDGTLIELYKQNLMSTYHIRHGGYGGIGYYHIADNYIALFSHFIPCGAYEAIYILDGLFKNLSDIQPDTIHGDSHAQSEVVFGLSYLLGIKLMPRIARWKHLKFYRTDNKKYKNIDKMFSDEIDWDLIKKYLPDMLRVALSIKEGKITASAILRKLGIYSRKSKLYQAFRELGRVVRTEFLLHYLNNEKVRQTIHGGTCKSESYNNFSGWAGFGGEKIIKENNRDEQRKIIKYNHLIANCISFYNVHCITKILNDLNEEGITFSDRALASISPYITLHINRFGDYRVDLNQKMPDIEYQMRWLN